MTDVEWIQDGTRHRARWRSEAGAPPPTRITVVDDRVRAEEALRRIRAGEFLLYAGDYHNARQLLTALGRRVHGRDAKKKKTPLETYRLERARRATEHAQLSRVLVPIDAAYRVALPRGPDVRAACENVWGPSDGEASIVALRELLGMIGAQQWRERGIEVPGLPGRIHPDYGVFTPTRGDYPALLQQAPAPTGKRVFDIGTGTGVLGFLALARGASEVDATDVDPRAVANANENARRLGFGERFRAEVADLFPDGRADVVICNPPWIPERPKTALDRAVFDPGGTFLDRLLGGVGEHLTEGGELWLILSDLPERLGLRAPGELAEKFARAGLEVRWERTVFPKHARAGDEEEALHAQRAAERTTLYALARMP